MKPEEREHLKTNFVVLLTLSKHSRDMGLHAVGSLGLQGWLGMVLEGCQNQPTGNSFSGRMCVFVVQFFYLCKMIKIIGCR